MSAPEWLLRFTRRLISLPPGRYVIILTIGEQHDWTIQAAGKVER